MFAVCALYQFATLPDYKALREPLYGLLNELSIKGTILLAEEGINGTISGTKVDINKILGYLQKDACFNHIEYKFSYVETIPFKRLKVKLKKEIVTMGVSNIDPKHSNGTYVEPREWNNLISKPDVMLIDTRNDYEHGIGSFKGAVNPDTQTFRDFPAYAKKNLEQHRGKKIAMFCTGGIRCEKSTAYLKQQGFDEVYHLKGGILKYLEEVDVSQSLWQGECFVFDDRVAVGHDLLGGQYDQCHACRYPMTEDDKLHKHYEQGVSCPRCYGTKKPEQLARYKEREKQMQLAKKRGEVHIGDEASVLLGAKQLNKKG